MPDALPIGLPPKEAIAFFQRKGYRISFSWEDVAAAEHARAFTVAKAMRADILADIRSAVEKALADGTTLAQFTRELTPVLQAKGWWGQQLMRDPADGEEKRVQLGSPRRLETIYDTNLRTSYAAGRWDQIQETKKAIPYLRYVAILDARTRPRHRAWHNTVLPVDHPFWATHYPPNGWHCRCRVEQLDDRDLAARGLAVRPPPPDRLVDYVNARTGEAQQIPAGIDPGFAHNVGHENEAAARAFVEKLAAVPPDLGAAVWDEATPDVVTPLAAGFDRWAEPFVAEAATPATGSLFPVAGLSRDAVAFLSRAGRTPQSAAVVLRDADLKAMVGRVPNELARQLPQHLANARAVLWDRRDPALVYVLDTPTTSGRETIVRVDCLTTGQRVTGEPSTMTVNAVRNADVVDARALADPDAYTLVEGSL